MENEIFVRDYRGRLHAEVDDGNWEAFIPVTLPFAEFALPEELLLLRDIAENAAVFCDKSTEEGNSVVLCLYFRYFRALPLDLEDDAALVDLAENALAQSGFPLPETDAETIALTRELLGPFLGDDLQD